jgi:hypothetical protein
MDTISAKYLITAKTEYENKLLKLLRPNIFNLLKSLYNNSNIMCNEENNPENILMVFQYNLEKLSKWKGFEINNYYQRFIKEEKCSDYFSDLIKIIFITHIRILTLLGHNGNKLNIEIPSPGKFVHLAYLEAARSIYQLPYLFYNIKENVSHINTIIENSILSVIQSVIPFNEIVANCNLDKFNIKDVNKKVKEDLKLVIPNEQKLEKQNPNSKTNNTQHNKTNIKTLKKVSFDLNNKVINNDTKTLKHPINISNITDLKLDDDFNKSSIKEVFLTDNLAPKNINEILFDTLPTKKKIPNPTKPLFYKQLQNFNNKTIKPTSIQQINNPVEEINNPVEEINNPVEEINNPVEEINNPVEEIDNPVEELSKKFLFLPIPEKVEEHKKEEEYKKVEEHKKEEEYKKEEEHKKEEEYKKEEEHKKEEEYKKEEEHKKEEEYKKEEEHKKEEEYKKEGPVIETSLSSSINLSDLISDINEVNLDSILSTKEKKHSAKSISPNKFSFFSDSTPFI